MSIHGDELLPVSQLIILNQNLTAINNYLNDLALDPFYYFPFNAAVTWYT